MKVTTKDYKVIVSVAATIDWRVPPQSYGESLLREQEQLRAKILAFELSEKWTEELRQAYERAKEEADRGRF